MRKFGYRDGRRVRNTGNGGNNSNNGHGGQGGSPVFTSSTNATVEENATLSHTLSATQNPTFSIVGGADQAQFEISGSTLRWASNGTQDYESPADADTNNTYVVTVRATKGSRTTDQTITVTVTDVAEGPTVTYIGKIENATSGSLDIGPANGTRRVVMAVPHTRSTAPARTITSGTIGGAEAIIAAQTAANPTSGAGAGILYLDTTGGGSTAFAVTFSSAPASATIYVYVIEGLDLPVPWDEVAGTGDNPSVTLGQPAGGVVIGCASNWGTNAFTWSGLTTEDDDTTLGGASQLSAAHSSGVSANASASVSATSATADEAICVVSFGGDYGAVEAGKVGTYYEDVSASSSSRQFTVDTGAADAGRVIVIDFAAQMTAAGQTISSATITPSGGSPIALTDAVFNSHGTRFCIAGVYAAAVPSGTTGAVVDFSSAGTFAKAAISVHRLVGYSATAHDTDVSDDTQSVTLDFPELGYAVVARSNRTGESDTIWTNAIEDFDLITTGNGNAARYAGAHRQQGAARNGIVISTPAGGQSVMAGASFAPA